MKKIWYILQDLIHFSMAAVSSVAFTRFTCKRINMDSFFSKCIPLKNWWGELLIWYISFSCAIFCPTIFSPNLGHPWSRFLGDHPEKEIGSTIGLVNVVHLITLFLNIHLRWFLNLYLRWSSRTLGSVCWAEGSSSNFKPSIWGIFGV